MNLLRFHNYQTGKEVWINPHDISSVGENGVMLGVLTQQEYRQYEKDRENFQWPVAVCIIMRSKNIHYVREGMEEVVQTLDTSGMANRDGVIRI